MSEKEAVLFANEAFYSAFAARDMAQMQAVWAEKADIACIHPGWPAVFGRDEVLESWRQIMANEDQYSIECIEPRAIVNGNSAIVICFEKLPDGWLVATNSFVREGRTWRLVLHQAGPVMEVPKLQSEAQKTRASKAAIH